MPKIARLTSHVSVGALRWNSPYIRCSVCCTASYNYNVKSCCGVAEVAGDMHARTHCCAILVLAQTLASNTDVTSTLILLAACDNFQHESCYAAAVQCASSLGHTTQTTMQANISKLSEAMMHCQCHCNFDCLHPCKGVACCLGPSNLALAGTLHKLVFFLLFHICKISAVTSSKQFTGVTPLGLCNIIAALHFIMHSTIQQFTIQYVGALCARFAGIRRVKHTSAANKM